VPWLFRSFWEQAEDEVFTNFPKVGKANFKSGKNPLYWGDANENGRSGVLPFRSFLVNINRRDRPGLL
jgi:hypothetical protein